MDKIVYICNGKAPCANIETNGCFLKSGGCKLISGCFLKGGGCRYTSDINFSKHYQHKKPSKKVLNNKFYKRDGEWWEA